MAAAVGVELFNDGMSVLNPEQTNAVLGRVGLNEVQVTSEQSYAALNDAGVDALLIVKPVMAGDGTPESASVRLIATSTGEVIAGLTWQNGWGGMRGSIADRTMRENLADAASQIASALQKRM